ncbi:zinc finger protein 678 isoform X2 [Cryptotermes secundus]|uniref:zinc finger protein 678 isoform X2 n=1 Tax=Cryptotermes secundus TaxID=105785 RepID=UPI000CD7CA19|nr:zinc finger protein 678 isoform X2 [Cryptotermes secundus]
MGLENVRIIDEEDTGNEMIIRVETKSRESMDSSCKREEFECKEQLCRLCACTIGTGIYIFSGTGREQQLANKINTCLPITVTVTDLLPKQLCVSCSNKLNICFDFAETCIKAEMELKRIMKIHPLDFPLSSSMTASYNYFNHAIRDDCEGNTADSQLGELNDDTDGDKIYGCPLCHDGNMILQKGLCNAEQIDIADASQFSKNGEIVEMCDVAEEYGDKQLEKSESKNDSPVIDFSYTQKDDSRDTKYSSGGKDMEDIPPTTFLCRFCGNFCPDLKSSLVHSKYHVNESGLPCVLCDTYFTKETDLENHFRNHSFEVHNRFAKVQNECSEQKTETHVLNDTRLSKCSECGKIFGTAERLSFHTQFHYGTRPLVCERCTKEFTSENMLFRHMNLVHGGTETCKKCGTVFMSKVKLDTHACELMKQPFRCKICRKQFQDTVMLKKHMASHNFILAKPFQCSQCDTSFTHISKLNMHVRIFHCSPLTPQICVKCNVCGEVFPNMECALLHTEKHTTPDLLDDFKSVEEIEATMLFCCEYCESLFTHMEHLLQHISEHSGFNPYHCSYCNMLFPDHNQMKFHKKYHVEHENRHDELSLFSIPLLFVCEKCEKSFNTWKGLQIHYNILHNGYPKRNSQNAEQKKCRDEKPEFHLCEDCGESFKKRADLRRHQLKEHRPQNRFPCEECGKVLLHYSGLIIHRRQHTGEKPFMCDVCGKSFPQGPAMYTHRRTHTRDYPYRCEICGQTFNNKGDLNNHRRSKHTKERPFTCNVCNKSFLTSGVYYQHKQLHAGIRKYKCAHCDRAFSRWNALSIHTKSHTGEKPHACHVCGRGFAQKGDMKKHMRTQHGVIK